MWVLLPALWAWMEILLFLFSELRRATLFTGYMLFTCRSVLGHDLGEVEITLSQEHHTRPGNLLCQNSDQRI